MFIRLGYPTNVESGGSIVPCCSFVLSTTHPMSHQKSKQLLDSARTLIERENAIQTAMNLGMPLHEIQEYLDWLDAQESAKTESLVVGNSDAPRRTARSETPGS
jgi:hypothetical protein